MVKNTISGFLIINKPKGKTSHDIVNELRHITGIKKIGHTGTLDPMATGVVIVAISAATRLIQYTHGFTKTYEAAITFGATSTTDDAEGEITPANTTSKPTQASIEKALHAFVGNIQQIPPHYAAIKVGGKRMYEYARQGKEVTRAPRAVTIHALHLLAYKYPGLTLEATVSTGTYIRALARDLGEQLKGGAYLSALHRRAIGPWTDKQAVDVADITAVNWQQHLRPSEELISHLPSTQLNPENVAKLRQGRAVAGDSSLPANTPLALYSEEKTVIGIGIYIPAQNTISPHIVLTYEAP